MFNKVVASSAILVYKDEYTCKRFSIGFKFFEQLFSKKDIKSTLCPD